MCWLVTGYNIRRTPRATNKTWKITECDVKSDRKHGTVSPYSAGNQGVVFLQMPTSISMTGTSINTPTTVASDAPEDRPNSMKVEAA